MPISAAANNTSAIFSACTPLFSLEVFMEKKENRQEMMRNKATTEVSSSMMLVSEKSETCTEVITKRQNPKRLAAVLRICCAVLFDILQNKIKMSVARQ